MDREEYRQLLAGRLTELRPQAVAQLQSFLRRPEVLSPNVLDAEVFPDSLFDGLPIRIFIMSATGGTEVAPSQRLLDGDPRASWSAPEREAIVSATEEDDDFDIMAIDGAALLDWFAACWAEAGGHSHGIEAYVGRHDADRCLRLKTNEWVPAEQRWRV